MFTAACVAAACAVLALFLVIANWWLARTATGRRRKGAPRWADTSPMPARPARTLPPLPPKPGAEQTQEIQVPAWPQIRPVRTVVVHLPKPLCDEDPTITFPRPVAGGTPTATHPGASERTGETAVPEGANA